MLYIKQCTESEEDIVNNTIDYIRHKEITGLRILGRKFMSDKSEKCKCVDCFFRWLDKNYKMEK